METSSDAPSGSTRWMGVTTMTGLSRELAVTASRVTNGVNALVFVLVGGQFKVRLSREQNGTAEGKYVCGLLKS